MRCFNCGEELGPAATRCERCGAEVVHTRIPEPIGAGPLDATAGTPLSADGPTVAYGDHVTPVDEAAGSETVTLSEHDDRAPEAQAPTIEPMPPATPARKRLPVLKPVVAVLAILVVALGALIAVTGAGHTLSDAKAKAAMAESALATANGKVEGLQKQVAGVQAQLDQMADRLEASDQATKTAQEAVAGCRDFFNKSAAIFNSGRAPSAKEQAQITAGLVACYEGDVPPGIFP